MKTRDAFALKYLYYDCVIDVGEVEPVEFTPDFARANSDEKPDYESAVVEEALLRYIDFDAAFKASIYDFSEVKRAAAILSVNKTIILKCRAVGERLDRHIVRLQEYTRQLIDKILTDGLNDRRQRRGERAKKLCRRYEYLLFLFNRYSEYLSAERREYEDTYRREYMRAVGSRIRQARMKKNLSLSAVARQLNLSPAGYGFYELGQRDPPTLTLCRLADMFDVSTDWLCGRTPRKTL